MHVWAELIAEAKDCFRGLGRFPLRAYSESMPPPWVALKPHDPERLLWPAVGERGLCISEYEQTEQLQPGLARIATHVLGEIDKLRRRGSHQLSKALLTENPAWPPELAAAEAQRGGPVVLCLPLALSRTQDDKGNVPWTLFGGSHLGPARALWRSFGEDEAALARFLSFVTGIEAKDVGSLRAAGVRILARGEDRQFREWRDPLPRCAEPLALGAEGLEGVRAVFTLKPFAELPEAVRRAYLDRRVRLAPSPASLLFLEHPGYRALARELVLAMQIALLHLFPRSESSTGLRIPQSGWLFERTPGQGGQVPPHLAETIHRTHRFERVSREEDQALRGSEHKVTTALFSTEADQLGLYGKPMARNAQLWSESYRLVLDGPSASWEDFARAEDLVRAGGRFGYRFYYTPMRAGARWLWWHLPLVARLDEGGRVELMPQPPLGIVTAERLAAPPLELEPVLAARPGHAGATRLKEPTTGYARYTTPHNVRRLLDFAEYLGEPLPPSLARRLLRVSDNAKIEEWIDRLEASGAEPGLAALVRSKLGPELDLQPGPDGVPRSLTLERTHVRGFEETLWRTIASLAAGEYLRAGREKPPADTAIAPAASATPAPPATAAASPTPTASAPRDEAAARTAAGPPADGPEPHPGYRNNADPVPRSQPDAESVSHSRELERLAAHLEALHREQIARHGMKGRAFVARQVFRWMTDFDFSWSRAWSQNRLRPLEQNVVLFIPGKRTREAVVMADHYDTAYMEDRYGAERWRLPAMGADDNYSATAALLLAAEQLLPLAREGKLERSVLLVHLTGEEFPADCLGARALAQALVQRTLVLIGDDGARQDLWDLSVRGVFVLDMVAHDNDRHRDVFQIAPGEGAGSARLAAIAHRATQRWNRSVPVWNRAPERRGRGRSQRGLELPPVAEHPVMRGEVRPEWDRRSALYNTDGQIFSDVGVPVVLFMEDYDINRAGYHDMHDTMENIDLDYGAALVAIAIETVAEAASVPEP